MDNVVDFSVTGVIVLLCYCIICVVPVPQALIPQALAPYPLPCGHGHHTLCWALMATGGRLVKAETEHQL